MEGGPGGSGVEPPAATAPDAVTAVLGADGVQRVEVILGDDLRFRPALVRARPGIIELTFRNAGATPHDVELPRGATGNLNGGQASTVRVSIDAPGRYPFPCRYHVSSGMSGTLDVTTDGTT
jgi:plastocyanin